MTIASMILAAAGAVPAFDPEAATRAYLDSLQGAARARSDAYFEGGYWLVLWSAVVGIVVHYAMLRFGWSAAWSAWAGRVTSRRWLQPAIYSAPYLVAGTLLALPWTIYTGFVREDRYGLMNLSFGGWAGEQSIGLAVGLVVTALAFVVLFAVIRKAPRSWWLWGAGATGAMLVVMIMIAPVFIAPLFNKYQPMAKGPLREQIIAMARTEGIPAKNVYVFDASKQTNRISANVSGLGPTIRISLNDNLLNRATPGGVKAVMGHEMGHYTLGQVPRLAFYFTLVAMAGLFLLWWAAPRILRRFGPRWGVTQVSDPAVAPLFAILFSLFGLLATPVLNSIIRSSESEADAYGIAVSKEPDGFASVAMLSSEYRKTEPGRLEEMLFYDHPSPRSRVRMAMEWKARHLGEVPLEQRGMVVMSRKEPAN